MDNNAPWLLETERTAAKLFAEAGEQFSHKPEYRDLLMQLSEDELEHVELLESLISFLRKNNSFKPAVTLSDETKEKISAILQSFRDKIAKGGMKTSDLIEILIVTELSEFNFFMLYLIELAKETDKSFTPALVNMQGHLSMVRRFVEKHGSRDDLMRIKTLPKVWDEKILVVDPSKSLISLLNHLMVSEASLTSTGDGNEAYDLIFENYYAAIIIEVHIGGMSGMDLFEKASNDHPSLKNRTIFMTSDDSLANVAYFRKNDLQFLIKPVKVLQLKEKITDTIISNRKAS